MLKQAVCQLARKGRAKGGTGGRVRYLAPYTPCLCVPQVAVFSSFGRSGGTHNTYSCHPFSWPCGVVHSVSFLLSSCYLESAYGIVYVCVCPEVFHKTTPLLPLTLCFKPSSAHKCSAYLYHLKGNVECTRANFRKIAIGPSASLHNIADNKIYTLSPPLLPTPAYQCRSSSEAPHHHPYQTRLGCYWSQD